MKVNEGGGGDIQKLIELLKQLLEQIESKGGKKPEGTEEGSLENMTFDELKEAFKQAIIEAKNEGEAAA
jgi:hypothetical protein